MGETKRYRFPAAIIASSLMAQIMSCSSNPNVALASTDPFHEARQLVETKQPLDAINTLMESLKAEKDATNAALKRLFIGKIYYDQQDFKKAIDYLRKAARAKTRMEDYARYYLALAYVANDQISAAKAELKNVEELKPSRRTQLDVRFQLGLIAAQKSNWRSAKRHFSYLRRKTRSTPRYPEVLWHLTKAEINLKRKWRACRWARKLYSKYPAHPVLADWGIDLHANKIDNVPLGCIATPRDQRSRLRRLEWSGRKEQAHKELEVLEQRATEVTRYHVDRIKAAFLTHEGDVDQALKLLMTHYEQKQEDFDFLNNLARAAAKAGEFQTAVGAYYKSHQLKPRTREGRKALFRSAFLSYQYQDYDGAGRKFSSFVKNYKGSGLSKDAHWYLAWIRYLKKDYDGALKNLSQLLPGKSRRKRRWYQPEKIKYWIAMSLYKSGRLGEAKSLFEQLSRDRYRGYYSVVAEVRLNEIAASSKLRGLASVPGTSQEVTAESKVAPNLNIPNLIGLATELGDVNKGADSEENETEEQVALKDDEDEANEDKFADKDSPAAEDGGTPESLLQVNSNALNDIVSKVGNFSDSKLSRRFDRARDLVLIGETDLAKWELYEIEKKTRNKEYLKMLMKQYQAIGAYHRSSYIGQVQFANERGEHGIGGIRYLWEFTYPQAYSAEVINFSRAFNVPKEMIWAIMRAESNYRVDIRSPVGATGLMQLMPSTATKVSGILLGQKDFETDLLHTPEANVRLGTRYLQRLLRMFDGKIPLVAAGYNAGPHRVHSWLNTFGRLEMDEFIEHIPFVETRNYVKKIVRYYRIYNLLYNEADKQPELSWLGQPVGVRGRYPSPTKETWEKL